MTNLKDLVRIDINDYRSYDPDRCCNGGSYSWHHHYTRVCENMWELTESTSADFCPYCRSWDCAGWCRDEADPVLVTDEELARIVDEWTSDDGDDTEVLRTGDRVAIDVWPLDDYEEA